jgi:hypothetical protein
VWAVVGENFPAISRATVYNTLNLFTERQHHFIDEPPARSMTSPGIRSKCAATNRCRTSK